MPTTTSSYASFLRQILQGVDTQNQAATLNEALFTPSIQELSKSFTLFPTLPTELRLQIWSHAISSLPSRIIPIHEITLKKGIPAYFSSRPHPLFVTINREARAAVFSTLQPLFLPEKGHTFVTVDLRKDVILFFSRRGKLGPKTIKRISGAMADKNSQKLVRLVAEIQIERIFTRYDPWVLNPLYEVIDSLSELFPQLHHFVLVPSQHVGSVGVEIYRGELYSGSEDEFDRDVEKYYVWAERYERDRGNLRAYDKVHNRMVKGPEGPEIHWGSLQFVGGEKVGQWDPVRKKWYWGFRKEEDYARERERIGEVLRVAGREADRLERSRQTQG
jgi:hypothetical protein